MRLVLTLLITVAALAGCSRPAYVDIPTRAYACPRGETVGQHCKGALVHVGNLYIRVDEDAARIQIHAEPIGNSGLLAPGTVAFRDCKIQDNRNWSCDEGRLMTAYYYYAMRDGVFRADWSTTGEARKIPIVAFSGPIRWVYRLGLKTPEADKLTGRR